ncbi:DNA topoisomerase [Quillaja saponaria]|uniref:DNA topoisomerase n=1 Tax=Quillaja saponaria TaxID=32244 RepID=A0AAD7Q7J9_QUISA|nr:DNA topoisomerase [Quillaja saponaria]
MSVQNQEGCEYFDRKGKRKMVGEGEIHDPSTPPQRKPRLEPQQSSPQQHQQYSPRVLQKKDSCIRYCPSYSFNKQIQNPEFPELHCRCGYGVCTKRECKNQRNHGRWYYSCPLEFKCGFFKWCDEVVGKTLIDPPPPYQYPYCSCHAGVCRKEKIYSGPNMGRSYFVCRLKKGNGACSFFQWEDTLVSSVDIVPVDENKCQEGDDFSLEHTKMMNVESQLTMYDAQCSLAFALATDSGTEYASVMEDLLESFELDESADMLSPTNDAAYTATFGHSGFSRHSHAGFILFNAKSTHPAGILFMGWWGRIVFPPVRCLKFPTPRPFFCCVFPSFNPIFVPKQKALVGMGSLLDLHPAPLHTADGMLSGGKPYQGVQLSSDAHDTVSSLISRPNISPDSEKRPISKARSWTAVLVQNQLIKLLETLDPLDYKSVKEAVDTHFEILDVLSVDYSTFSEHVLEFVGCISSLVDIEQSVKNYLPPQQLLEHCNREKARFDEISHAHNETKALFEASTERLLSLREEASRCEAETSKLEINLREISKSMMEFERTLQFAYEEVEVATQLGVERDGKRCAAEAALEKARSQLSC